MYTQKGILLVVLLMAGITVKAQSPHGGAVKWMSFEQAIAKQKVEKRKIFVDVYTQWCGWCKVMDAQTFTDAQVAALLNTKFYAVKFDAEQKGDIHVGKQIFKYVENGGNGVHQLAVALLNNQLSYPNSVFLDENLEIVPIYPGSTSVPGFHKPKEFHAMLDFVGGSHYKKQNIDQYKSNGYKSPY